MATINLESIPRNILEMYAFSIGLVFLLAKPMFEMITIYSNIIYYYSAISLTLE